MANVIEYDPTTTPIANRVKRYLRSVQEADWQGKPNIVLNFDASGDNPQVKALVAAAVPMSRWKVVGSDVLELTAQDDADIATAAAADAAAALAARIASVKLAAKNIFVTPSGASNYAIKLATETLIELIVTQLNTLRAQHSLGALSDAAVKAALVTAFNTKVDSITQP